VPRANNELQIDTSSDESDELMTDTFGELDELKITFDEIYELLIENHDLAAFRRVNLTYDPIDNDPEIDVLELRTACFLGALPQLPRTIRIRASPPK
jgi:hypothetical protein